MLRKQHALEVIESIVKDKPTAEMLLERLQDEGMLHLGYGDADIDQVVGTFKDTFGNTKTTKYDRFAANRLVQKYGAQSVVGVMKLLAQLSGDKYAPTVGSVAQLEDKWVSVLAFVRKKGQETEVVDV